MKYERTLLGLDVFRLIEGLGFLARYRKGGP